MHIHRLSFAILAALTALPALATAQDEAARTELETIVVKGEKTDRAIQDTTTSIAVVTARRIEQENLLDVFDILQRTANTASTYGNSGYTIRGIADRDGEGAPLSTLYIDGAAMPQDIIGSGPNGLWDIAQVEILRGPQSTIQGENALAGAIVLRTEDPTMFWSGRVRAGTPTTTIIPSPPRSAARCSPTNSRSASPPKIATRTASCTT